MANRFSNLLDDNGNCHIYGLLPSRPIPKGFIYGNALAIQLAIKHLNEGNGRLVSEVDGLNNTCPIRFSASILDTKFSQEDAFEVVDNVTTIASGGIARKPCAFVGAIASSVSQSTAQITGLRGIPQVSQASTNVELDDRGIFKYFARTIPSDEAMAEYLVTFLYCKLKANYLFVIVQDDPFTKSVMKSLRAAVLRLGLSPTQPSSTTTLCVVNNTGPMYVEERMIAEAPDDSKDINYNVTYTGLLDEAFDALNRSDFRFVLHLATNTENIEPVMEAAHEKGLVGTSNDTIAGEGIYNWWFYETLGLSDKEYESNNPLANALDGVGYIHQSFDTDTQGYYEESLALKKEFYQRNNATDRIATDDFLFPVDWNGAWNGAYLGEDEWLTSLEDIPPFFNDRFAYDATILLGLSACREVANNSLVLEGENFYNRIKSTNFAGVTGNVTLDSETGTRRGETVKYVIDNWRAYEEDNRTESLVRFNKTTTYILEPGSKEWQNMNTHYFNGGKILSSLGSTPDLAPMEEEPFELVAPWIQGLGFGFLGIILLATLVFVLWVIMNWNTHVVRASQPHFLLLICLGIIIMALSLYPISMMHTKEQVIDTYQMMQTEEQPEDAYPVFLCTSVWYFIMIGFGITFSTLFAKTYRINQIIANSMKCKRIQLSIQETLYPVAAITIFNIIMLVLMTTLRPVYYAIVQENDDRFGRPTEIYGNCKFTSDGDKKGALPFLLPTIAVNFIMVFLGLFQTWRARNLATEFSESRYIGMVLVISLLVALFAIPILILTQGNPNVDTFVRLMLASIIPGTTLFFIFIPKMIVHAKSQEAGSQGQRFSVMRASFSMRTNGSSGTGSGRTRSGRVSVAPFQESGEKIVTGKSQQQLAAENASLEQTVEEYRTLNEKQQETIALLERRIRAGDENKLESTAEIESNRSFVFQSIGGFFQSNGGEAEA